jgi:hypothetical protein
MAPRRDLSHFLTALAQDDAARRFHKKYSGLRSRTGAPDGYNLAGLLNRFAVFTFSFAGMVWP